MQMHTKWAAIQKKKRAIERCGNKEEVIRDDFFYTADFTRDATSFAHLLIHVNRLETFVAPIRYCAHILLVSMLCVPSAFFPSVS